MSLPQGARVRRTTTREASRALLIGLVASQCACAALLWVPEPIRIGNWADMDECQLSLASGRTTLREAEQAMRRAGLTGIRSDTYVEGRRMVSALAADYQTKIYIFEDNRYQRSLPVRSGSALPFGYALRVARSRDDLLILALYRDPSSDPGKGPRIAVFTDEERGFEFVQSIPMDELARTHGGMTSPFFVGHDLDEGLMFLARSKDGGLWENAYLVTLHGRELGLKPLPMEEAAQCSCVEKYVYATSSDELGQD
jgi:hypothetical protein